MAPIRVLQVVSVMDRGGIETMLMNHYRKIDTEKIQFDFLVHGEKRGSYEHEIRERGGCIYRVRKIRYPWDYPLWMADIEAVLKRDKPDVIHVHLEPETRVILKIAEKVGIPVRIAHSHSTRSLRPFAKRVAGKLIELFYSWHATRFLAASRMAGEWLFGKKIVNGANFEVFKNAIDLKAFKYDPELRKERREQLGIPDDAFVLGHVGRFTKEKNHTFIIDVFVELLEKRPDAILLLIGDGPLRDEIGAKVGELRIPENSVRFLGVRRNIPAFCQAFDCFILPSLYEGLGIAAIEAQATGLPCLLSDVITPETKVTDLLEYLPLAAGPAFWAEKILEMSKRERKDHAPELRKQGWGIRKNVLHLTNIYLGQPE